MLDFASEIPNPVVPAMYDVAFSVVPLVLVAAMVAGLVSIMRRYRAMSGLESFGWTVFVVVAPVLGTLVWFFLARQRYTATSIA